MGRIMKSTQMNQRKKYETISQEQYATQHNYAENKKTKMESVPHIFPNLNKINKNSINLNENENTRNEKRKRCHKTSSLEKHDEQKKRKNEYLKQYRKKNAEKIKQKLIEQNDE